jgi:exopolyphosphatase/guanosine-5'-triphosphate,3'-diphosphate pyrophosphatase
VQRVAIIDLGSNTARLVAYAYEPQRRYQLIDELRAVVRLSQGMGSDGLIRDDAFERGIEALRGFRSYCDAAGIDAIHATATSAVRAASNRESFLAAAEARAGISLQLLDEQAEAAAGVVAVANSLPLTDALVLDVGGGSAQLSLMQARRFAKGASWLIGAVRATEAYLPSDPPKKREIKALQKHVRKLVTPFARTLPPGLPLVGMGGTVRNLAEIQQKREGYPIDLLHGYVLEREALRAVTSELLAKSVKERKGILGLSSDRADIIAAGALVVLELLELLGAPRLTISGQGIREGLFYSYLLADKAEPLLSDVRAFSVLNLMRRYYDQFAHNRHVQKLALSLFDQLGPLHRYSAFERQLLADAALLHDIGMAVNYYDHHKHGFYLTMSAALPGLSHREQALVALLVRYHRKGTPSDQGLAGLLQEGDMTRVSKLAALLRLAEYLERAKAQRVKGVRCHCQEGKVRIEALAEEDPAIEVIEAAKRSELFASAFGVEVEVVTARHGF